MLIESSLSVQEEGDPGKGGLQGTRSRAGQLEGPSSRGLRGWVGLLRPSTLDHPYPIPARLSHIFVTSNAA
eukprot:1902358-Pyramimonas_sp.AAC.1